MEYYQQSFLMGGAGDGVVQVTFGDAGTGAGNDASSPIPVPYPSGISAGDFLLLHVVASNAIAAPTITTPSGGWALIDSRSDTGLHKRSSIFWKTADGSETGSLDVSFGGSTNAIGRMYRFSHGSGVEAASGAFDTTGSNAFANVVSVTTTVAKALAVQCIWALQNTTVAAITGESGGDYTEAVAEFNDATLGVLSLQTAEMASAGLISGGTAALGVNSIDVVHGFAILP